VTFKPVKPAETEPYSAVRILTVRGIDWFYGRSPAKWRIAYAFAARGNASDLSSRLSTAISRLVWEAEAVLAERVGRQPSKPAGLQARLWNSVPWTWTF
jgi:hypothetical protein